MKRTMEGKPVIIITAFLAVLFLGGGLASNIHMIMFSTPLFLHDLNGNVINTASYIVEPLSFTLFGLLFLCFAVWSGTILTVDEEGISLSFLSYKFENMTWNNMKEICVISDDEDEKKRKYIYFSNAELSVLERFKNIYPTINYRITKNCLTLFVKEEDINIIRKMCGRDILSYTEEQLYDAAELLLLGEPEKKHLIECLEDENRKLKAELG
ncbi:MAG: hypothetical protein LIP12_14570 [Clostridiales bacterium]|nr:hypothetical protein [Clostridiales bacterium]